METTWEIDGRQMVGGKYYFKGKSNDTAQVGYLSISISGSPLQSDNDPTIEQAAEEKEKNKLRKGKWDDKHRIGNACYDAASVPVVKVHFHSFDCRGRLSIDRSFG